MVWFCQMLRMTERRKDHPGLNPRQLPSWGFLLALFALGLSLPPMAFGSDGPGRGVARLSLLQGDVSIRRGDSGDWVAAAPNVPLVVQDRVLTGVSSRAEVQLDYANFVRLAANSEIRFAELEYRRFSIQLASGTVTYRVLRDLDADVEVATPSVSVRPLKRGVYRISVRPDNTTEITVRAGEVEIYTPRGTERLRGGRTMLVRGSQADPEFQLVSELRQDDWDRWNEQRDRALDRSQAYRYVSRSIFGAEDLDLYGDWIFDPPYGWVWVPRVPVGWAPYRFGRWAWIDWYGWSWVSYDPWGWAPFHFGRWYWGPRGWCWYPGLITAQYFWSPGLVAWIGFGSATGFYAGVGWGSIGWVPLAPFEPFYPWYGWRFYRGWGDPALIDNSVQIVNNINITNVYRNARVRHAVSGLSAQDFVLGRGSGAMVLSESDLRSASLMRGSLPVVPDRASLRFADREILQPQPGVNDDGRFYSRRPPQSVERVPFEQQRRGIEEMSRRVFGGRGFGERPEFNRTADGTNEEQGRTRFGERGRERVAETARRSENGWLPDSPTLETPSSPETGRAGRNLDSRGWRRFGEPRGLGRNEESAATDPQRSSERNRASSNSRPSWRSLGDSQGADPGRLSGDSGSVRERGNWRRFGEATGRFPGTGSPSARSPERGAGWRYDERNSASGESTSERGRTERRWRDSLTIERGNPASEPWGSDRSRRRIGGSDGSGQTAPNLEQIFPGRSDWPAGREWGAGRDRGGRSGGAQTPSSQPETPRWRNDYPSVEFPRREFPRRVDPPRLELPPQGGDGAIPLQIDPPIVRERAPHHQEQSDRRFRSTPRWEGLPGAIPQAEFRSSYSGFSDRLPSVSRQGRWGVSAYEGFPGGLAPAGSRLNPAGAGWRPMGLSAPGASTGSGRWGSAMGRSR
ncbi:MAG: FecR domain-containing protein [Bryobacteraceae bacterium]|nr:FecR domain-containing protein [Bryobacteraceae bacterium]MDW8379892.1 FecR domain-containing protein [Bryobacterales bacterium]